MRRGLDGFSCFYPGLMRFSRPTEAVSQTFGGEIARGKHLFPFRTEPLSLSAPMVLGGQPPGRVGRRRSYLEPPSRAALSLPARGSRARSLRVPLGRQLLLRAGAIVQMMRSTRGQVGAAHLTLANRLRLDPVLAERREVDHEVGRVEQPLSNVNQLFHGREGMDRVGRHPLFAGELAQQASLDMFGQMGRPVLLVHSSGPQGPGEGSAPFAARL